MNKDWLLLALLAGLLLLGMILTLLHGREGSRHGYGSCLELNSQPAQGGPWSTG